MAQVAQERNRLQSLSQTHFIGENAGNTIFVQRNKPVQTCYLVVSHLALDEAGRLAEDSLGRAAVLLVLEQLSIFLGFGAASTFAGSAALSGASLLCTRGFLVLAIDFGHDFANLGVRVRLDEVTEKVGKA